MGRELRKVIPHWEHPKNGDGHYLPLYNQPAEEAWGEWITEYQEWVSSEYAKVISNDKEYPKNQPYSTFCDWYGHPPDPQDYRPHWEEKEMTWWQIYETVTEGTPVTPPFATKEELIEYLVKNGTFWDQGKPWSRSSAENFVNKTQWAPTLIMQVT